MKGLFIYDTEADGLAGKSVAPEDHMTKFHVMLFKEYGVDNWKIFLDHQHPEFEEAKGFVKGKGVNLEIFDFKDFPCWVESEPLAIGCQNQYGYDLLAIAEQFGMKSTMFPESIGNKAIRLFDTLSMSRALYPDRPLPYGCPSKVKNPTGGPAKTIGPHSLEAYGYKLKNLKVTIEDWKGLPLWKYCDRVWQDVIINELQFQFLVKEMNDGKDKGVDWRVPLQRCAKADWLMVLQEQQGVCFDYKGAEILLGRIDKHMESLELEVEPILPLRDVPESERPNFPKDPFNKDGSINHHGWNYAKNVLGYTLNNEYFSHVHPPKTSFKKDGTLSSNGYKYCMKMGCENEDLMPTFIREMSHKTSTLKPLPDNEMLKLRSQLENKYIPEKFLKQPMKLSNQEDIKRWLVEVEGWIPTLFNFKDATKGSDKKKLPDFEIEEKVWDYVVENRNGIYAPFLSGELDGLDIRKITSKDHKDFKKLLKKARRLPTSAKFKDERGKLCPMLDEMRGDMAKKIVTWLSCRNRRSVIKTKDEKKNTGWLNHPRLKLDGKLPARYSGLTPTFRRKHSVVANVPSTDALYGQEMRDLFTVPEGYWQWGIDGSNLEGMVAAEAAYPFDGGEYYRSLSGDQHSTNAAAYSAACRREVTRSAGKSITYGIMYGAQAPKIAVMLGVDRDTGQKVIDAFWNTNFGLKGCKEYLEKFWESTGKKYILGFDKRKIYIRSKHSLLNAYLQSGGAIGMDIAGTLWHERSQNEGLLDKGVARTIYYHDEYQLQVPESEIQIFRFPTGFTDKAFVKRVLSDVKNSKKLKKEGEKYKTANEMLIEYSITMQQLKDIIKAESDASSMEIEGKILSGNSRVMEDGSIARAYSRANEIMVQSIEDAYSKELGFTVPITGSGLFGKSWGDCH